MVTAAPAQRNVSRFSQISYLAGSVVLLISSFGCGRPFNIKTQPSLPPSRFSETTTLNNISIGVQAITDEDLLYDTFDANLITAGLLPVRVLLTNTSVEPVDISEARFELQAGSQRYKAVDASKAFKRLMSYYEVSAYTKAGYKASREAFEGYALKVASPLNGNESRQGLVFVMMPEEVARKTGLTMIISRLGKNQSKESTAELRLN
jgi:hypothetical protein